MKKIQIESYLLVLVQFLCLVGFLYLSFEKTLAGPAIILFLVGSVLFIWARHEMGRNNFRVIPIPKASAQLVTSGPYKAIRHPMYAAVLLAMLGVAININTWLGFAVWIVLFTDLIIKMRFEEKFLLQKFPEYKDYMKRTKRLVPWIW